MSRKFFVKATAVAALTVATSGVAGAQINLLNIAGQARIESQSPSPPAPIFLDFLSGAVFPPTAVGFGAPGNVFSGTNSGIFTIVAPGTNGVMNDLTITPSSVSTTPGGPSAKV